MTGPKAKFINPLPLVADIEASKQFYCEKLGLSIIEDHGDFVKFDNGFALHEAKSLLNTIFGEADEVAPPYGRQNLVLYFEVEDLQGAFDTIRSHCEVIHPIQTQDWGQRVFRFYDPDRHIVEIGEPQ